MKEAKQLLLGLLDYIGEQAKLVKPEGFQLSKLAGPKFCPQDLADLPGLQFNVAEAGGAAWLRMDRLEAIQAPEVPAPLLPYASTSQDPSGQPPAINGTALEAHLAANPDVDGEEFRAAVAADFELYASEWWGWSEQEKPRRRSIDLYTSFFALKQQIEAEETAKPLELVWGVGVASWKLASEEGSLSYEYPLMTQSVEIVMDEKTMAIEIRPRDIEARLELDALVAASVIGAAEVELTAKKLLGREGAADLSPFDPSSYAHILKLVASNLDAKGSYHEVLAAGEPWPAPGPHFVVTDAWILLARPRQHNFLLEDLKRLKTKVEEATELPSGPLSLVTPPSDQTTYVEPIRFRGLSTNAVSDGVSDSRIEELYFPLPSNEEQITIIERLERAPGVTVQGPPGTGKTHTIANVICHYLATGRRVLVTSRGEPALQVLQEKLPTEVRPLTVALLSSDRDGTRQFQASIEAIQHSVSQLNPRETQRQIETLKAGIDRTHHELSGIERRLDAIAADQLGDIEVDGEKIRAQKAAELLLRGQQEHGWLQDNLTLASEHQPPLSEDDMSALRLARRLVGDDLVYLGATLPDADGLPSAEQVGELHETLISLKTLDRDIAEVPGLAVRGNTPEVHQAVQELLKSVELAQRELEILETAAASWGPVFRERCRNSSYGAERAAFEAIFGDIDRLVAARAEFLRRPVVFPVEGLSSPKAIEGVARAAQTGKPFALMAVGARDAKKCLAAVKVSGLPPQDADGWQHVQRYVLLHQELASFVARWNTFAEPLSLPTLSEGTLDLRNIETLATAARKVHRLSTHLDRVLVNQASSVYADVPALKLHGGSDGLKEVAQSLRKYLQRATLARAAQGVTAFQERLAGRTGEISENLRQFGHHLLGQSQCTVEQVSSEYVKLVAELRRVSGLGSHLGLIAASADRLRAAGAVLWAERIEREPCGHSGDDKVTPAQWRKSWTWARLRGHLEQIEARHELRALATRRSELTSGLQRLYSDLVAKSAWLATKNNATGKIMSALNGYATAIRRIGQGTGANAPRYRRDARDAMNEAAGAVPCWIMPHARISEAMPADIGAFDLVVVDEASQSDLWALPAILRGKKILVVGDDKQVSPDGGFIAAQQIELLRQRFLGDQPFAADMTPEKSLYDLAARVFASHQVMLREHFRCVSPIISYSNRFYGGAIRPLRIPLASERIDPPLVDIFVPTGRRDTKDFNRDEAEVIADEIGAIIANPAWCDRTLGVVSLLGIEQAKYIDEVVRARFPAAELLRRKFTSGEPRAFQGSERDIVFLSMVADRDRHHALSRLGHEQRFNVAASRARDRMYLVRSVELGDLSEVDLRRGLIEHFSQPAVPQEFQGDSPIDLCESGFEREVFTKLTERGYRVIPQVKVGGFRIDMVVEGADDRRLAIELDGDEFHGPDRWAHDMSRQRILERAGWTFWRCFASTWSLHKDEVLAELLSRLHQMQIAPIGALGQLATLVERRVWQPRTKRMDEAEDEVDLVIQQAIDDARTDSA
ncbi:AAA domain-containing protein [Luteibacter sp. PPL552]